MQQDMNEFKSVVQEHIETIKKVGIDNIEKIKNNVLENMCGCFDERIGELNNLIVRGHVSPYDYEMEHTRIMYYAEIICEHLSGKN